MGEQEQTVVRVQALRSNTEVNEAMVTPIIDGISRLTSVDFHQYKRNFVQRPSYSGRYDARLSSAV